MPKITEPPLPIFDTLRATLRDAKTHVFRLQDAAEELDNADLRRCFFEARSWLEAADRRLTSIQLGGDDNG